MLTKSIKPHWTKLSERKTRGGNGEVSQKSIYAQKQTIVCSKLMMAFVSTIDFHIN